MILGGRGRGSRSPNIRTPAGPRGVQREENVCVCVFGLSLGAEGSLSQKIPDKVPDGPGPWLHPDSPALRRWTLSARPIDAGSTQSGRPPRAPRRTGRRCTGRAPARRPRQRRRRRPPQAHSPIVPTAPGRSARPRASRRGRDAVSPSPGAPRRECVKGPP